MLSLSPGATVPLLLLMGVVLSVAVHQGCLWLGRGRDALHPWVVAWCANSLLLLVSHCLQTAETREWAGLGARLAWMSSLLLIAVMIGLSHALAGRPLSRPVAAGIMGANLALLVSGWVGGKVVQTQIYLRTCRLGGRHLGHGPRPLLTALGPGP